MGIINRNLKNSFTFCNSVFFMFVRNFSDKVPKHPHVSKFAKTVSEKIIKIDLPTVRYLERLSLVNFGEYKSIEILESSIKFAEQLVSKDTAGIKPLSTVLENRTLSLRDDVVSEGSDKKSILCNAKVTEEEYFVAPPGNIPVEPNKSEYKQEKIQRKS